MHRGIHLFALSESGQIFAFRNTSEHRSVSMNTRNFIQFFFLKNQRGRDYSNSSPSRHHFSLSIICITHNNWNIWYIIRRKFSEYQLVTHLSIFSLPVIFPTNNLSFRNIAFDVAETRIQQNLTLQNPINSVTGSTSLDFTRPRAVCVQHYENRVDVKTGAIGEFMGLLGICVNGILNNYFLIQTCMCLSMAWSCINYKKESGPEGQPQFLHWSRVFQYLGCNL